MADEQEILRGAAIDFCGALAITFLGVLLIFGAAI